MGIDIFPHVKTLLITPQGIVLLVVCTPSRMPLFDFIKDLSQKMCAIPLPFRAMTPSTPNQS